MGTKVVKLENPTVCEICGGTDVEELVWHKPNTGEVTSKLSQEGDNQWCNTCQVHVALISLEEYNERNGQET